MVAPAKITASVSSTRAWKGGAPDRRAHTTFPYSITTRRRVNRLRIRSFSRSCKPTISHDARLLVGCQVGGRSTHAAQMLASHGYQHVVNVRGGFGGARDPATGALVDEGWSVAGLPVETTAPQGGSYNELRENLT